jgi:hypothetical protein
MKLLQAIRFDASDERVYEHAAEPGEWAVSGAFAFADLPREAITGKTRQAFANGFLGVTSFGRSTFAAVAEISAEERQAVARALARHFLERYGAPSEAEALAAAEEELAFVEDLCAEQPINIVFTVRRTLPAEGGIREEFRVIAAPRERPHARVWDVAEGDE